jgi:TFIIH basal transcription factor complex TTD-A subunit
VSFLEASSNITSSRVPEELIDTTSVISDKKTDSSDHLILMDPECVLLGVSKHLDNFLDLCRYMSVRQAFDQSDYFSPYSTRMLRLKSSPCLTIYSFIMVKAAKGVLVQCDESIMAIIIDIDNKNNNIFILEILDSETCLVQASKLNDLKIRLTDVSIYC